MTAVIRIGLAWQSITSSNLGVGALGLSQIGVARAAAARCGRELQFFEFCHSERDPQRAIECGIRLADPLSPKRMLLSRSAALAQISACDLMLDIGAGDSFTDIYGPKRFMLLSFLKWCCLHVGTPLVMSPQTIGPFDSGWTRMIASSLMRRARRIFARDTLSMDYLRGEGIEANAEEAADVAFRLPFERQVAPADGRIHVGLNVSGLLYNGGYTGGNQFGLTVDYRDLIDQLVERLHSRDDVVLHLVGHVNSRELAVEDDYRICEQLVERFPRIVLAPRFETPSAAKGYISGLHFFTGARMHACIGAFSSGVPVVPMAYSRKFNGLFQSLGYTALADLRHGDTATALRQVTDGLATREALSAQVAAGNVLAQRKLQRYEDYLTELLEALDGRPH